MELLVQLGVNSTLGLQMAIFLVVFLVLKYLLFAPYFAAFVERKERTQGKTELAERFVAETHALEERYSKRAQEVNDGFRAIFDRSRADAVKDYDRVLNEARTKAKTLLEKNRVKIQAEVEATRGPLMQEVASVSQLINHKLIGKDLTV